MFGDGGEGGRGTRPTGRTHSPFPSPPAVPADSSVKTNMTLLDERARMMGNVAVVTYIRLLQVGLEKGQLGQL